MEQIEDFPQTVEALDLLVNDLKCSKCSALSETLYSAGVCEHMLCSDCSDSNLGIDCPICGLPSHVKDAQVNRQLSNMVKLCQDLRGLLTSTGSFYGNEMKILENGVHMDLEADNAQLKCVPNGEQQNGAVYDFVSTPVSKPRPSHRNKPQVDYRELQSSELSETETTEQTPQNNIWKGRKRGQPNSTRTKSNGLVQTTMTQLFDDLSPVSKHRNHGTPKVRRNGGKIQKTPGRLKSQTPKQTKGNNSGVKGRQPCGSTSQLSVILGSQSPKTPSTCKRRQTDPSMRKNAKGETPLHVAVIKGDVDRVRLLLEQGSNPNSRDNAGWTPLHEACNHGYTEIAELLLNNGALVNTPGMENDSPLHDAVSNNRVDCVRLLVSRGASQTTRNIYGQTVRDIATSEAVREALQTEVTSSEDMSDTALAELRSHEPVVLLGTALSRDQKVLLRKSAYILQARVVEEFTPEVTHVVTSSNLEGQCPRTLKYLRAILTGKWVLNLEWVKMCIEYKSRVSEEPFVVSGSTPNPDTQAVTRGRLNEIRQLPRLFDGCKFYFSGTFEHPTPDVTELIQLVRCGGGAILSREPKLQSLDQSSLTVPYHVSPESHLKDCGIFIVHDNRAEVQPIRSQRLCTVTVSWLMDSIASFKLLDLP